MLLCMLFILSFAAVTAFVLFFTREPVVSLLHISKVSWFCHAGSEINRQSSYPSHAVINQKHSVHCRMNTCFSSLSHLALVAVIIILSLITSPCWWLHCVQPVISILLVLMCGYVPDLFSFCGS